MAAGGGNSETILVAFAKSEAALLPEPNSTYATASRSFRRCSGGLEIGFFALARLWKLLTSTLDLVLASTSDRPWLYFAAWLIT